MTELKTKLSLEDLITLSEPVHMVDLRDGRALEVFRVEKNSEAILHFITGVSGYDKDTTEALEIVRAQCLTMIDRIRQLSVTSLKVECGASIADAYDQMVYTLEFLVDLVDPASIPKIDKAFVAA